MQYPAECPVFEFEGKHYTGRPYDVSMLTDGACGYAVTLILDAFDGEPMEDWPAVLPEIHEERIKPLTPSARRLLAWSRQK